MAVLAAVAMVSSVLVAAPAVAADPEPDYGATFDACGMAPSSGFEDVPSGHANAGDIDCIAYYAITKGTSETTYSPLMSVSREHMALFLARLAKLVGIESDMMGDDMMGSGFTDIGDLSDESQKAIGLLKDLEITKGTSDTTYSPGDNVTRGQMALFIARLMDHMVPMADGQIGLSTTTQYGYTPSDVAANDMDADIGSSFTDLGRATKDEYDAITQLYELGVAAGISDTSYSPGSDITRAAMAGFMAAVLDHSNVRPAGLSIQVTPSTGWGDSAVTVIASMRDDMFRAVEDQAIDIFSSAAGDSALRDDGTCNFGTNPDDVLGGDLVDGNCEWDDNDDATDVDGNLITDGDVAAGSTRTFYAWIGNEDGDKFDSDKFTAQTASASAKHAQDAHGDSSTINRHAFSDASGQKVDLRATSTVTFTIQLRNAEQNVNVERSGVKFRVRYDQGPEAGRTYTNTHEAELVTDDEGKVSFTVTGPTNTSSDNSRMDEIIFTELLPNGNASTRMTTKNINWVEEIPVLTKTTLETPTYVLDGNPSIGAVVRLWDQYGNSHRSRAGQTAAITIGTGDNNVGTRNVISRGYARWSRKPGAANVTAGTPIAVSYAGVTAYARDADGYVLGTDGNQIDSDAVATGTQPTTSIYSDPDADPPTLWTGIDEVYGDSDPANVADGHQYRTGPNNVHVVNNASSASTGQHTVTHLMVKDGKFLALAGDAGGNPTLVFSYDDDDTFIDSTGDEGRSVSMERFQTLMDQDDNHNTIGNGDAPTDAAVEVEVVIYNADGTSVFRVTNDGSGS
nr:S-layer homology domain-containing protein [bacterium]